MSQTTLYEDASKWIRPRMSDPPGGTQTPTVACMLELRAELDRKITELGKQRRELHLAIEKDCAHPLERRALIIQNNTDTLGNYMRGDEITTCRDCGKYLKTREC